MVATVLFLAGAVFCVNKHPWWGIACIAAAIGVVVGL